MKRIAVAESVWLWRWCRKEDVLAVGTSALTGTFRSEPGIVVFFFFEISLKIFSRFFTLFPDGATSSGAHVGRRALGRRGVLGWR